MIDAYPGNRRHEKRTGLRAWYGERDAVVTTTRTCYDKCVLGVRSDAASRFTPKCQESIERPETEKLRAEAEKTGFGLGITGNVANGQQQSSSAKRVSGCSAPMSILLMMEC